MTPVNINISDLKPFIDIAFEFDREVINIYDKNHKVETTSDVCENIYNKIKNEYETSTIVGIKKDGVNIGYFVTLNRLLISFGLNIEYRDKEHLKEFFSLIKEHFAGTFQCVLYSYNLKGIGWLKRCGMKMLYDEVSILQFDND